MYRLSNTKDVIDHPGRLEGLRNCLAQAAFFEQMEYLYQSPPSETGKHWAIVSP